MAREPIVIVHEIGPKGQRKFIEGTRPGKWKETDPAILKEAWAKLGIPDPRDKDDKTNDKEKPNRRKAKRTEPTE